VHIEFFASFTAAYPGAHLVLRCCFKSWPSSQRCARVWPPCDLLDAVNPRQVLGRIRPYEQARKYVPSASEMLVVHMRHVLGPRKRALWHIQLLLEAKVFAVNAVDVEGSCALMMTFGVIHWPLRARQALRATMRSRSQPMAS
jgi:hypothetical protein